VLNSLFTAQVVMTDFRFQIAYTAPLLLALITCSQADEREKESGDGRRAAEQPVGTSDEGKLAMGSFRKPQGWEVSLFAAEPELANPVALAVDNRGRVFVCESFRQDRGVTDNRKHDKEWLLADLSAETVQDRIDYHRRLLGTEAEEYTAHDDQIRLLEDTDGDRVADRASVFASGFNRIEEGTGAGVLARGHDVYYTCIPNLWLLSDEDLDGRAEQRRSLHTGYGVRVAFRGHDSHGLIVGPDGRLYFSIGDRGYNIQTDDGQLKNIESGAVLRCELDGSGLEVYATGLRNPQELAFDDYGYLFTGDNNSDSGDKARWVQVMQGGDSGWRMMYQYLPDRGPFNRERIWEPYSASTPAYVVPPIANIGDGPSGLTCYPGTGLSGDFANCFFLADFRGGASNSGIRLIRVEPRGAFWEVVRSEELIWNILATDVDFGPDGALWICDWVNGWIGEGKGRIYRFFDSAAQNEDVVREVEQLLAAGFSKLSSASLTELLTHADRRVRLEAQWELATRGDIDGFIATLANTRLGTFGRLHSIWGLGHTARRHQDQRNAIEPIIAQALQDSDLDVRAAAASVVGDLRWSNLSANLLPLLQDSEPRVQYAACLAVGRLGAEQSLTAIVDILEENDNRDPGLRHAGIMALAGIPELASIVELSRHTSPAVRQAAVVALRKRQSPQVVEFLNDQDASVQLEAARAIHDVPELHSELPELAGLAPRSDGALVADALAHRILNANFRLGGMAAAEKIATFAANPQNSSAMRMEAIAMLGDWANPAPLDRVMNRFAPLEPRASTDAVSAFSDRLAGIMDGSDDILSRVIESAVALKLPAASKTLSQFATNTKQSPELRRNALAGLVQMEPNLQLSVLRLLLDDKEPLVRAQALTAFAEREPDQAMPFLARAIHSTESTERQAAWDILDEVENEQATQLIEQGLADYIAGRQPTDVWLNVIEASEGRVSEELSDSLFKYEQQLAVEDSLAPYRDCVFGGDPQAGRKLFFTKTELSCVRCHQVDGEGGAVGPDLSQIGKAKDSRYLLESIVDPDAKIAENFETVVLLTEDNQVITGILKREDEQLVELIDAQGTILQIDPDTIVSRKKGKSAMPVDLLKGITRRELRDLVAYLATLTGTQEK
jgi:quinoprotein glucose dehydrogenase